MTSVHDITRIDSSVGAYDLTRGLTLPWEVPPNSIVIEYFDGRWRVVPHRGLSRSFATREEAWAWARQVAACFLPSWTIIDHDAGSEHDAARLVG